MSPKDVRAGPSTTSDYQADGEQASATGRPAPADLTIARKGTMGLMLQRARDLGVLLATLSLFVFLSVSSDAFLSTTNMLNIVDQWAGLAIAACAGTFVLIAGGFDLSTGAIYALSGIAAAELAGELGIAPALLIGVLVGVAIGGLNGLLVTLGRVNSFLGTLAMAIILRGLATGVTGGQLVTVDVEGFNSLARGRLFGVRYPVFILILVALVLAFVLSKTVYGKHVIATGGSPEAARLSGVRTQAVQASTFVLSGAAAGLAGVIAASRISTGQADAGVGIEFIIIVAIVIGGTSIFGGEGSVSRTLLGILLLALIGNGFNLLSIDPIYQQTFQGGIILLAILVDAQARKLRT